MIAQLAIWTVRSIALACFFGAFLHLARVRNPYILKSAWTALLVATLVLPILTQLKFPIIRAPLALTPDRINATVALATRPPSALLELLYFFVTALFVAHYGFALARMARIRRAALRVCDAWSEGFDVRTTAHLGFPATFGRTILLPHDFRQWSPEQLSAVIAHERAHVLALDCHRLWLARLYVCLCWFNPLSWWLVRRLAILAEETSDAAAVQLLGNAPRYAETLLAFASLAPLRNPMASGITRSNLEARIERIIGSDIPSASPHRSRSTLVVAGLLPALAFCALLHSQPDAAHATDAPVQRSPERTSVHVMSSKSNLQIIRSAYPPAAAHAGTAGWAYVRVTIDPQGRATHVRLIRVTPAKAGFGAAALKLARTLRYSNTTGRVERKTLPLKFQPALTRSPSSKK